MQRMIVTAAIASPLVFLGSVFPGALWLVAVLVVMMLLDYVSGMVRAWMTRTLSSRTGLIGIVKKLCYLILIAVALGVDYVVFSGALHLEEPPTVFALVVAAWLIINEALSVLENLAQIGVPVPKWLDTAIRHLLVSVDRSVDKPVESVEKEDEEDESE